MIRIDLRLSEGKAGCGGVPYSSDGAGCPSIWVNDTNCDSDCFTRAGIIIRMTCPSCEKHHLFFRQIAASRNEACEWDGGDCGDVNQFEDTLDCLQTATPDYRLILILSNVQRQDTNPVPGNTSFSSFDQGLLSGTGLIGFLHCLYKYLVLETTKAIDYLKMNLS